MFDRDALFHDVVDHVRLLRQHEGEELAERRHVRSLHDRADTVPDLDRPDHRQRAKRLAQHGTADIEAGRKLALGQKAVPGLELARQQLLAQKRDDPLVAARDVAVAARDGDVAAHQVIRPWSDHLGTGWGPLPTASVFRCAPPPFLSAFDQRTGPIPLLSRRPASRPVDEPGRSPMRFGLRELLRGISHVSCRRGKRGGGRRACSDGVLSPLARVAHEGSASPGLRMLGPPPQSAARRPLGIKSNRVETGRTNHCPVDVTFDPSGGLAKPARRSSAGAIRIQERSVQSATQAQASRAPPSWRVSWIARRRSGLS